MNETLLDFDTTDLPKDDFSTLPKGWYPVQITSANIVPTKAGTGKILKLELSVIGGEYAGRKIFDGINISNPNDKAQEIGRKQLGSLLESIGKVGEKDVSKFVLCRCKASVRVDDGDGAFGPSNKVNRYAPSSGETEAPAPKEKKSLRF